MASSLSNLAAANATVSVAWAKRPGSPYVGQRIRCTDLGNKEFYWNGTVWLPMGGSVLAQSGVVSSVTGTTTETTLASITVPGGMMGPNGALRVIPLFSCSNNANSKIVSIYLGGVSIGGQSLPNQPGYMAFEMIQNRNSLSSQVFNSSLTGVGFVNRSAAAINTAVDQQLDIRATLTNVADGVNLERYTIEILPG
jgi:hypothetical protein